jgi:two-component system sensor histidine kinase HydH
MEKLLIEKGAALIRSFEAGARTGVLGMSWGGLQIQKLLVETAQQPDIAYLMITDLEGFVLAHNNPAMIGKLYAKNLNLTEIARSKTLLYREIKNKQGPDTFEVLRYFSPSPGFITPFGISIGNDWFKSRFHPMGDENLPSKFIIFIGLDTEALEKARLADARNTFITAIILLLVGLTGIISLLIAQGYRQTRTSLSQIKAFSDTLVENMPMGLIATDNKDTIIFYNHVAESVLLRPATQVYGKKAAQVLPPVLTKLLKVITDETPLLEREIILRQENGHSIPLGISATMLMEKNVFWGHVLLFRDLTEVKRLKKEIDLSQRLASLGRLAAGVAHEIRNPLSSIKGFATYFKERYQDVPDDQKIADIMIHEVERLNRVIGQLLDFAHPMKLRKKPVALVQLINDSLKMIENKAKEKQIEIVKNLPAGELVVELDADRINQVLLNVYLNAIEAMNRKGRLAVDVKADGAHGIFISISDNGVGIKKEDIAKIFDPYFTTKPAGTGLGLAIVHQIIEYHGGTIHVESSQEEGSVVHISLPVSFSTQ